MKMMLSLEPQMAKYPLQYQDNLLMIGSCFSDHMGSRLREAKFNVQYNPTGIVFDPLSLATHLNDYATNRQYDSGLFTEHGGLWHSWQHHSDFSAANREDGLMKIRSGIEQGHKQLQSASYLFITLGTAFSYELKETQMAVANCHKAPGEWFEKKLLTTETMIKTLQESLSNIFNINPGLQVVFTVSPVKHIRDGLAENNRSKARLLETAHALTEADQRCSYFPAYELVNDVLRDYRFYARDMAHPSEQAVDFIFDFFCKTYFRPDTQQLLQEVLQIVSAKKHKVLHQGTIQHQQFFQTFLAKTEMLKTKLPMLNWEEELAYFSAK